MIYSKGILRSALVACGITSSLLISCPTQAQESAASSALAAAEPDAHSEPQYLAKKSLPWIMDVTVTFSSIGHVSNDSYGYTGRGTSLGIIATAGTQATVQVGQWPASAPPIPSTLAAWTVVAENVAPVLEQTPEIDAEHVAKTGSAIETCRQQALLALSRPGKYSLIIRVAGRSDSNLAPPAAGAWPAATAYVSEEYFSCRLARID